MELGHLRHSIAAVEEGSVTVAAEQGCTLVPQPTEQGP
jgi:DNA-binding transcriptional LysR family regulator